MPRITNHNDLHGIGFPCGSETCDAIFTRSSDRNRHEKRHQPYTKRPFKCDSCDFRANQKSGLKCHQNSVHLKKRILCRVPGCKRDFSDPSTLSRHMNRRHRLSSKKRISPPWVDLTSTFTIRPKFTTPVDATVADGGDGGRTTKVERRSPDVSSANITLHTSPLGRQEGFSCQDVLLDSARFRFAPSPTLPSLGPIAPCQPDWQLQSSSGLYPYQPDWQFQSSSGFYPSGSGIDFPSCSTAILPGLSLPETNLSGVMTPCGFQIDAGMPDAYGTFSEPAEQTVETYFHTLLETPVDDFLAQSTTNSSFPVSPNTFLPGPSLMGPMTNYDATCSDSNLFGEASQWQIDTPPISFGYDDETEYCIFTGLGSLNF